jgi:sulfur-oxidizing protein SoxB
MEDVMSQTAITYPYTTLTELSGAAIKGILEDVADTLFNPDPYRQLGGDLVRVGGMSYICRAHARMGQRITDIRIGEKPMAEGRMYKVAGWAPVAERAHSEPIWNVVRTYLSRHSVVPELHPEQPRVADSEQGGRSR